MIKEEEEWDRVYYAMIHITDNGHRKKVLATGKTILEVKLNTMTAISKDAGPRKIQKYSKAVEFADLGTYVAITEDRNSRLCIVYCEAKIHIYGNRWGYENMLVEYDPCYEDNLLRFIKYKRKDPWSRKKKEV